MSSLFDPLPIRGVTLPDRIVVSPISRYSSVAGFANDRQFVQRASEAVTPEGRVSPRNLGIQRADRIRALSCIAHFAKGRDRIPATQLAHAGRKASATRRGEGSVGILGVRAGWKPFAPGAARFSETGPEPRELSVAFAVAAERALEAGFRILEIHAAHGYPFHEFYSPLSSLRQASSGVSSDNRPHFPREAGAKVRSWRAQYCAIPNGRCARPANWHYRGLPCAIYALRAARKSDPKEGGLKAHA
jgi:2,4-dienoyl-CoA reductase-like NADH-dependent reductase (Old Yellow Enzyme family)